MSQGYAITNALTGLAATAFTWNSAYTVNRTRLNDGIMDEPVSSAASPGGSPTTLSINLGTPTALVGFALLNHNLASGACTVGITAGTDGITYGTTAKATTTIVTTSPDHKDTVLQFPSASFQYWRLTFVHTGSKVVTLGEVLAFTSITTLTRASIYGDGEEERAIVNRNVSQLGHQRATFVGGPVRTKRRIYKDLSLSEKAELRAMWAASNYGVSNILWLDFIESASTAATANGMACLWGKIEPSFDWTQGDFQLFDPSDFTLLGQGREVGS